VPPSSPASASVGHTFGRVAEAYERWRPEYSLAARVRHVIAVEPDAGMRAFLDGDARPGTAEQIPVADGEVDAVFVGDAFIWFDPAPALAEIVRVLRPAGGLALLWNDWYQREEPPLPDEVRDLLTDLYLRFRGRAAPAGDWRDDIARSPFGPLRHASFEVQSTVSGHYLAELELTRSSPAALEDGDRLALAERIRPLMAPEYALTVVTSVDWTTLA